MLSLDSLRYLSVLRVKAEENLKSSFTNKIKLKVGISTEENKIVKLNSTFKSDTTETSTVIPNNL